MKSNNNCRKIFLNHLWSLLCYWKNSISSWIRKGLAFFLSSNWTIVQVFGLLCYQFFYILIAALAIELIRYCLPVDKIIGALYKVDILRIILDFIKKPAFVNSLVSSLIFADIIWIVHKLTPLFNVRKQELRITASQIIILLSFGAWLFSIVIFWGLNKQSNLLTIAILGSVMSWIFQDTVKSVVAFLYLRINGMIHIGDWIQLESKNIDGMVKGITLTMVTIENWDTTLTSFPTYLLHSESLKNLQPMLQGKTLGRRMVLSFTIDSGWIQPTSLKDVDQIIDRLDVDNYFKEVQIRERVEDATAQNKEILNLHLFRRYIHHWLMNNKKISRQPRLIVRYLEPTENGIPMQIYAYITDTSLEPFEWAQSSIIEHILESMKWFNLRIFQNASAFDVSNSNIYLSPKQADYTNYPDGTAE